MQKLIFAACLSASALVLPNATHAAAPVPCEKSYSQAKAAMGSTKLASADKTKAADLVGKGLERCKADDDAGADDFFAQAMKLMGK